jgi:hypothetical protein
MFTRFGRKISLLSVPFVLSLGLSAAAAAACLPPASALPPARVQSFLSNPSALLASNPNGGGDLINMVRQLVASDNTTLQPVIQLLSAANVQQRTAIGTGLASAAQICLPSDQAYSGQIQTALAASGDRVAITAFVSAGGQEPATAATGAGAPGETAFVSGTLQVTGASPGGGLTPPVVTSGSAGGSTVLFTFATGAGATGASTPVSP